MFPLSVCIIAKNEEAHIEECLKRLVPYGFEIVLTDTGSTDQTLAAAAKYTDRIFHFDWCDDFSAARNFCMEKASHNWILSLDCDEYIENLELSALGRCMEQYPDRTGRILIRNRFWQNGETAFEQVRVSRLADRRYFHFAGAVHEQLERRDHTIKAVYDAPVTILHVGYDETEADMQENAAAISPCLQDSLTGRAQTLICIFKWGSVFADLAKLKRLLKALMPDCQWKWILLWTM